MGTGTGYQVKTIIQIGLYIKCFELFGQSSQIPYSWLIIYCLIGTLVVWKCKLEIFVHKLSPNWPQAGNSSGSISDARIISCLDLWLFGKVKVIYKHYQSNFQCTGVLSLYRYRSLSSPSPSSKPAARLLSLPFRPNRMLHDGNFFVKWPKLKTISKF